MSTFGEQEAQQTEVNREDVIKLEGIVIHNTAKIASSRSYIGENSSLIAKNNNYAFTNNHALAIENSDHLFRDRVAFACCLPAITEEERRYRDAMINKMKLAHLAHRSTVNTQVLEISNDMTALNTQAIAINRRIMQLNENIKNFNSAMIEENVDGCVIPIAMDPDYTAVLIAQNTDKFHDVQDRVNENNKTIETVMEASLKNRGAINKNSEEISVRHEAIVKNQSLIAGIYERWSAAKRELKLDVY